MAKQKSTFQFSGKIGTIVGMKGANGESYIREYVKPANPKSTKQTEQRVKMSLGGLLSKLTAQSVIYGMGTTPRKRRPTFVSNIVRRAVITSSGGQVLAKINPADILFSDGVNQPIAYTQTPTLNGRDLEFPWYKDVFDSNLDLAAIVFVAVAYNSNSTANAVLSGVMVRNSQLSVVTLCPADTTEVAWYYIPVFRAEGVDSTSYQRDLQVIATDRNIAAVVTISERGSVEWRRSVYAGRVSAQ